ncbi:hypothetical protein HHK36_009901 [Tetracentron sinense]|uniref:Uncharacterized protein n=1 Tax=Tetracentron sinense TaxID=13715 RepID=A0A834ZJU4_TETSI|nr:hypothetical protein HHK36_009901 [Tetracentron sinense]
MASSTLPKLVLLCFFLIYICCNGSARAQVDETSLQLMNDALDWPMSMSLSHEFGDEEDEEDGGVDRRSLFWRRFHYYISYGALSANRIPCPPRSGRSYYTHNCYRARGPVHPYTRGDLVRVTPWTNFQPVSFSSSFAELTVVTLHPEIIDGKAETLVIESFVVDMPNGN